MNKLLRFLKNVLCLSTFIALNVFNHYSYSQTNTSEWQVRTFIKSSFVENKGQFNNYVTDGDKILYGVKDGMEILFTKNGLIYRLSQEVREDHDKYDKKKEEYNEEKEEENRKYRKVLSSFITMNWVNSNPNVQVLVEDQQSDYWNYTNPKNIYESINYVRGYKKLIYKNLYPGIDAEYVIHPEGGIKYSFIIQPGADPSQIKMRYDSAYKINKDPKGNLNLFTKCGEILDHAPVSWIESDQKKVNCEFVLKENIVSFRLDNYDSTKTLIIDPWTVTTFMAGFYPYNIASDAAHNVYVYGYGGNGTGNYVQKYNAAGVLQWTFNATAIVPGWNYNIGDITVDQLGNSYFTGGLVAGAPYDCGTMKLNTSGVLIWNNYPDPLLYENWCINFNCDYSVLLTSGCGNNSALTNRARGVSINPLTGTVTNQFSGHTALPNPTAINCGDILSSCFGKNGYYYFISSQGPGAATTRITALNSNAGYALVFNVVPSFNHVDANFQAYGGTGYNGIIAGCDFLWVNAGSNLEKRNLLTGALIGTVAIPAGAFKANGGIGIDKCNNIYVGSTNGVYVFDSNLNFLTSYPTPSRVSDIEINQNGTFFATGPGGTAAALVSPFLSLFNITTTCSNPLNITSTPANCNLSGSATANATLCSAPYSYLWSDGQTTQTATGLVPDTYTCIVTGSGFCADSDTATVTITGSPSPTVSVNSVSICGGDTAVLIASGASSYTWSSGITPSGIDTGYAFPTVTTTYTVIGTSAGCSDTAYATVTVGSTNVNVNSVTICQGATATLVASGANTYTWSNGATGNSISVNPVNTTTYTVIGSSGSCADTSIAIVTVNPIPILTISTTTVCQGDTSTITASGAGTYTWSSGVSATGITTATVIPVSGSTYSVVGSTNGCINDTSFTIPVTPLPIVTVNSPTICSGDTATLVANGATSYTWSSGLIPSGSNSATVSPNSTNSYTVTGTTSGCSSSTVAMVTVGNNISALVNSGQICSGQSITLNASGGTSYSWNTGSTNPSITVSPSVTTIYTVTVSVGSCSSVAQSTVTVNPSPQVIVNSNSPVCANQTLNLFTDPGYSYNWSGPPNFSSIQQNPVIAGATTQNAGTYTLIVTDTNLCTYTATLSVTINPLPIISTNNVSVCLGDNINLSATGGSNYSWSGPNNFTSNSSSPIILNANPSMSGNYTVTSTDNNGCTNSDIAVVNVNALPIISVNSLTVCSNIPGNLLANGAVSYTWTPSTGLSNTTGNNVLASPVVSTSYTVTGTDINGCIDTAITLVTVNGAPSISMGPSIIAGCAPLCVTFTNSSESGTYLWSFGDGTTSSLYQPSHCFNNSGTYSVQFNLVSSNGCSGSITSTVIVYPQPLANFSADPQPTTMLDPSIHFTDASTLANIVSYNWNFGDPLSSSSNQQNPIFEYQAAGTYTVTQTVTSDHGCIDTVRQTIIIDDDFVIYIPNAFTPGGDSINDEFRAYGVGIKDFKMMIFDRWGEMIFESNDIQIGWNGYYKEQECKQDVYVWKIEVTGINNTTKYLVGHVNLIR